MTRTTAEALPLTPFGQTLHNLRQKIAHVIVTKVLQEEYDDLVEGYLDEILLAADDIIRLPAYSLVAQTYHDNLSAASAEPAARDGGEVERRVGLVIGGLHLLAMAVRQGDPTEQLLFRINDTMKDAEAALTALAAGGEK